MDLSRLQVPVEKLRWVCDASCFTSQEADGSMPQQEFVGQDRAIKAIRLGLSVDQPGYNIFVTGVTGTDKTTTVKTYIEGLVRERIDAGRAAVPSDWCYLYNFDDADRPRAAELPAGQGKELRRRLERLLEELRTAVPGAFSEQAYEEKRKEITEESQEIQRRVFQQLDEEARQQGFAVQFSPMGVALVPLIEGKPASQEQYLQLAPEERRGLEEKRMQLMKRVQAVMEEVREAERRASERLQQINKNVAEFAVAAPFDAIREAFQDHERVASYLDRLRAYTIENIEMFHSAAQEGQQGQQGQPSAAFQDMARAARQRELALPFEVNVFVDNSEAKGPPIILENNPTYTNLFGRIERKFMFGGYITDHTLLKPGAVHLANGGYLVLEMRHLLTNPLTWETLKRTIKTKESRPEDPFEAMGLMVSQVVKPEAVPVDVKVVITGDSFLYGLLSAYDQDFWETFKVKADFDSQIRRTQEHLDAYADFVRRTSQAHSLLPFDAGAMGKVAEYGARLMGDQERLSTRFGLIRDVLIEADYWAKEAGAPEVAAGHVKRSLEEKVYRSDLIAQRIREMMEEGTILVETEGAVAGQVNGLAVHSIGDVAFGRPSRITARTFIGRGGVINIEREAQLSGKTHDKGVLILSGFLGWKYAQKRPLSVSASIAFEQSYQGIDGDSASSTEVYAILSSLAGVPLKQGLAVTGSVNQRGEVQAIGGANEKIEGFFDLCKARGLTGDQGVLIPAANVRHLMLREDVVQAVQEGRFHVYAVNTIDEGIELLTGMAAGEKDEHGNYPEGTIHHLVNRQLDQYAEELRAFSRNGTGEPAEASRDPAAT